MSALGGTAEVILGAMFVVAGIGLLRRLRFAWSLAILLLVITVALRIAQGKEHIILIGKGSIAVNTAEELKRRGVQFVQIVPTKPEGFAPKPTRNRSR
jgi:hypothetical protein